MYEKKVDKGSVFILVFLITATTLGYLMIGGTLPTRLPGYNNNLAGIPSLAPYDPQQGMQMRSFLGATITPYPTLAGSGSDISNQPLQYAACENTLQGTLKPQILWGLYLGNSAATDNQMSIKIFYADQSPLLLGAGNTSPMSKQPADRISKPTINLGDLNQKDPNNIPYTPAIFLTDITTDPNNTTGDPPKGTPQTPSIIYGSWKSLGAQNPSVPNAFELAGGDPWPPTNGPDGPKVINYTTEIVWKINELTYNGQPLVPGNTYRAQIIIHNGNNLGDIGQTCATFTVPQPSPSGTTQLSPSQTP